MLNFYIRLHIRIVENYVVIDKKQETNDRVTPKKLNPLYSSVFSTAS